MLLAALLIAVPALVARAQSIPPVVTTGGASNVTSGSATLNGSVNPNGNSISSCFFNWGTTTNYGHTATASNCPSSGTTAVPVSAFLAGLSPNTTYHFQLEVVDGTGGMTTGSDQSFTTLPPPDVATQPASSIADTSATLNGSVNPNGNSISGCSFEWGTTQNYGQSISCAQSVGSGTSPVAVSAGVSGLSPNTTYHFLLTVTTTDGTFFGADRAFTTSSPPAQPSVTTTPATNVSTTKATLTGIVNPAGQTITKCFFGWGATARYGQLVPCDQTTINGSSPVTVTAAVAGLSPRTTYHFELAIAVSGGYQLGGDQAFTTMAPLPPPVLGKTLNLVPVSGMVFLKLPGSSPGLAGDRLASPAANPLAFPALSKGQGFVPITQARNVPIGSQIDARLGTLQLTAATTTAGKTQAGVFGGAIFGLGQVRSGLTKGLTTLSLLEGDFPGAPSFAQCQRGAARDPASLAAGKPVSHRVLQALSAHVHGHFQARGHYSSATVRGTEWTTTDRCDGTLTQVSRGTVAVRDFTRRKTVIVQAGHSYLAKASTRKHK